MKKLCPVRVLDYNHSEKFYDNSIFYQSFVSELVSCIGLSEDKRDSLLVNTNLVMQMLDEKGLSPYKTFESISRFAHLLAGCRGDAFSPRISHHKITDNSEIILIEPPCGSNTAILKSCGEVLFIDTGYALYREEMEKIFRSLLLEYDTMKKRVYITQCRRGPLRPSSALRRNSCKRRFKGMSRARSKRRRCLSRTESSSQAVYQYLQSTHTV